MSPDKKVAFFGCLLDSDEREESVQEKLEASGSPVAVPDPYTAVVEILRQEVAASLFEEKGLLEIPEWLTPFPSSGEKGKIRVEDFVSFMDREGCRDMASMAGAFIRDRIHPDLPCMIGIDHALTGGAVRFLSESRSPKEMSLIVLDSHTDALPMSVLSGAISYDLETNPASVHDPEDPFLSNRSESYNACSYLYYLLEEGVVEPRNLYLIGIGDYPPKRAFRIKDSRIERYVKAFTGLKESGVGIVTKSELLTNPSKIKSLLRDVGTPSVYISIDMDVGAGNALEEVRFRDRQGISERQLYGIADRIVELFSRGVQLAGMDVMEFNPRRVGPHLPPQEIPVYRIAANLIKRLCFPIQ